MCRILHGSKAQQVFGVFYNFTDPKRGHFTNPEVNQEALQILKEVIVAFDNDSGGSDDYVPELRGH